ncbi:MAG: hypothetical protein R3F59_32425 [Myxococcota bacterium]
MGAARRAGPGAASAPAARWLALAVLMGVAVAGAQRWVKLFAGIGAGRGVVGLSGGAPRWRRARGGRCGAGAGACRGVARGARAARSPTPAPPEAAPAWPVPPPSPGKPPVPVPVPDPVEAPAATGSVAATGSADAVWLERDGARIELGDVPPGTYGVIAGFKGQAPAPAGRVTVRAGQAVTLSCSADFQMCQPK